MEEEIKKPMLTDPKEFAIIRKMYFDDHAPRSYTLDPLEALDRQVQGKQRNQAR